LGDSGRARTVELCNVCDGLVGWARLRDGCCLGGVVCKREQGTRFEVVVPAAALTIAEDALRDIASGKCMHALAGDGLPSIDTSAPSRVAEGALKRIADFLASGSSVGVSSGPDGTDESERNER
jgi:hypothetical protein